MEIMDLNPYDNDKMRQTAQLLFESFSSWVTFHDAMEEVIESLKEGKVSRVAIDSTDQVVGWIAGYSQYHGNVWEIHPLVVGAQDRKRGIGRALVSDFEECVKQKGAITIILGADDEDGRTTLADINLYPDIHEHISKFNGHDHPTGFYQKLGFTITGVIPDANGIGKPDILMAKRVGNI